MEEIKQTVVAYEKPVIASYTEEELEATIDALGASGMGGGPTA